MKVAHGLEICAIDSDLTKSKSTQIHSFLKTSLLVNKNVNKNDKSFVLLKKNTSVIFLGSLPFVFCANWFGPRASLKTPYDRVDEQSRTDTVASTDAPNWTVPLP